MSEYQYSLEDLQSETRSMQNVYHFVTRDYSISLGVNGSYVEDAEIWFDSDSRDKTLWFASLDELDDFVRAEYPDGEWDE